MIIKQGTTIPFEYQITDGKNVPIDLTNAKTVKFSGQLYEDTTPSISLNCEFVDRVEGLVTVPWGESSTSILGMYRMEFEIEWTDGKKEKVPSNREEWMLITASNTV